MFRVDPEGSQRMFEEIQAEPEMKEIEGSNGEPIRYYVYDLKD